MFYFFVVLAISHMSLENHAVKEADTKPTMPASLMSLKPLSGVGLSFIKGSRIPIKLLINSIIE